MAVQNVSSSTQTLDKPHLLRMYEQMQTIRTFEEMAGAEFLAEEE